MDFMLHIMNTMKLSKKTCLYILMFFVLSNTANSADRVLLTIAPKAIYQGSVACVTLKGADISSAILEQNRQRPAMFYHDNGTGALRSIIGIDLEEEQGEKTMAVTVTLAHGEKQNRTLTYTVLKKKFPTQQLTLPESQVTPNPENEARIEREHEAVKKILGGSVQEKLWDKSFMQPIPGEPVTVFGMRRFMNGLPKNPHTGIDMKAPAGMPVAASADGIVVFTGEHFFSGNSVFIDHGAGICTMYFHLASIAVQAGQRVKQGDTIGAVGSTGRSTGPHLHWGVRINNQRIDPLALVSLFKKQQVKDTP